MTNHKEVLGHNAADLVSKVKGIVDSITESITGSVQYSVSPRCIPGKDAPTAWSYDYQQVTVGDSEPELIVTPAGVPKFALGEAVSSTMYPDLVGFVHSRTTFMNGCIGYRINPFDLKTGKSDDMFVIFQPLLKSIQHESAENNRADHRIPINSLGDDLVLENFEVEENKTTQPATRSKTRGGPKERSIQSS